MHFNHLKFTICKLFSVNFILKQDEARTRRFTIRSLGGCFRTPNNHAPTNGPDRRQQWGLEFHHEIAKTAAWLWKAQFALP